MKIALDNGFLEIALRVYNNLATALPTEEYERIIEYFEKGLELAKKIGHIAQISWTGVNLSYPYYGMGNANKASSLVEESVALDRKSGNISNLAFSLSTLGAFNWALGEWDKSEQLLKEALNIAQRLNQFQQIAGCYEFLGWLHFDKEEYVKAREFFDNEVDVYEKAGAKYLQISSFQNLVFVYIELGEIEKANNLIDRLSKFALEVKDKQLIANVNVLRAGLFRAQKRWEESIEYFEKSLQEFEALNARKWNVYFFAKWVLYEYA